MYYFTILKIGISALVVVALTEVSRKFPELAGFLVAMPIVSLLTLVFSHIQHKEQFDVIKFCKGMLAGIPVVAMFCLPFLFIKGFYSALAVSLLIVLLSAAIYKKLGLI